MNYELAKQLKDAGFPFRRHFGDEICCEPREEIDGETLIIPDLSELIEACGDGAAVIRLSATESNAWSKQMNDPDNPPSFFTGSTPEEAVARLWLALNQKV